MQQANRQLLLLGGTIRSGSARGSRSRMVAGVGVANGHGWIACVPETSPDDLSNQGICDRTPQVLDHLVEIVAAAGCAQVTANHLARAEKLDLSGICMAPLQARDFSGLSALPPRRSSTRRSARSLSESPSLAIVGAVFGVTRSPETTAGSGNNAPKAGPEDHSTPL